MLRESEEYLLKSSRTNLGKLIRQHLRKPLLRKFRSKFWDKDGNERNWGAMKEADITALFTASRNDCYYYIADFLVFDFNGENVNVQKKFPIITQND